MGIKVSEYLGGVNVTKRDLKRGRGRQRKRVRKKKCDCKQNLRDAVTAFEGRGGIHKSRDAGSLLRLRKAEE